MRFKRYGFHHIPLAVVWTTIFGPVPNMLFWLGKEYANAREKALKATRYKIGYLGTLNPKYWQMPDLVTPTVFGFAGTALWNYLGISDFPSLPSLPLL